MRNGSAAAAQEHVGKEKKRRQGGVPGCFVRVYATASRAGLRPPRPGRTGAGCSQKKKKKKKGKKKREETILTSCPYGAWEDNPAPVYREGGQEKEKRGKRKEACFPFTIQLYAETAASLIIFIRPLCLIRGEKGKREPRPCPAQPDWNLPRRNPDDRLKRASSAHVGADDQVEVHSRAPFPARARPQGGRGRRARRPGSTVWFSLQHSGPPCELMWNVLLKKKGGEKDTFAIRRPDSRTEKTRPVIGRNKRNGRTRS